MTSDIIVGVPNQVIYVGENKGSHFNIDNYNGYQMSFDMLGISDIIVGTESDNIVSDYLYQTKHFVDTIEYTEDLTNTDMIEIANNLADGTKNSYIGDNAEKFAQEVMVSNIRHEYRGVITIGEAIFVLSKYFEEKFLKMRIAIILSLAVLLNLHNYRGRNK